MEEKRRVERTIPDHHRLKVDRSNVSSSSVGVPVVDGGGVDGEVSARRKTKRSATDASDEGRKNEREG